MELKRLRDCREDSDKTQADIAQVLSISKQQYQLYESGKRTIPIDLLIKLAKYYEVSLDYLAGLIPIAKPQPGTANCNIQDPQTIHDIEFAIEIKNLYKKYYGGSKK